MTTTRGNIRELDPAGGTPGQVPTINAAGDAVEYADPAAGSGTGVVETIVPGSGIAVDSTDPANPVVSATGGGGGGGTTADTPPSSANAKDDEFSDLSGQSGPVNGLAAKWSKRNLATSSWLTLAKNSRALGIAIPASQAQDQAIYQAVPAGDFRAAAGFTLTQAFTRVMFGIIIVDTSGNGVSMEFDNGDSTGAPSACIRNVAAWAQTGTNTQIAVAATGGAFAVGSKVYASLRKSGSTYYGAAWTDPSIVVSAAQETAHTPTAFTPAYVGVGQIYHGSAVGGKCYAVDWFRIT